MWDQPLDIPVHRGQGPVQEVAQREDGAHWATPDLRGPKGRGNCSASRTGLVFCSAAGIATRVVLTLTGAIVVLLVLGVIANGERCAWGLH